MQVDECTDPSPPPSPPVPPSPPDDDDPLPDELPEEDDEPPEDEEEPPEEPEDEDAPEEDEEPPEDDELPDVSGDPPLLLPHAVTQEKAKPRTDAGSRCRIMYPSIVLEMQPAHQSHNCAKRLHHGRRATRARCATLRKPGCAVHNASELGSLLVTAMDPETLSQVKGLMIFTLKRYILEEHGEHVFERYAASAPEETRDAIRDPLPSRWYPEVVMRDAVEACHRAVCNGSDTLFSHAMEKGATLGTHWFFRMLVQVTSPRYLVRLMPTALRQMRRGSVKLDVELRDTDATLRVTDHPFADHPLYRLATPAILGGLVRICTPSGRVILVDYGPTTQVVLVQWADPLAAHGTNIS